MAVAVDNRDNRMKTPGSFTERCQREIETCKEFQAQAKRDVRCKIIQAVALSVLFSVGVVTAFVLTSLYAPAYAPITLFLGTYLLIERMGEFLTKNFKEKWIEIEREAAQIRGIAEEYSNIMQNFSHKEFLLAEYASNQATYVEKYACLEAHHNYWEKASEKAFIAHEQTFQEALNQASDKTKQYCLKVQAQRLREDALQFKVNAAFIRALMKRPDYNRLQDSLPFITHYAPIPLNQSASESEKDLMLKIPFDSPLAENLLQRDLPPYEDRFLEIFDIRGKITRSFSRLEILQSEALQKITKAFIEAMDQQ